MFQMIRLFIAKALGLESEEQMAQDIDRIDNVLLVLVRDIERIDKYLEELHDYLESKEHELLVPQYGMDEDVRKKRAELEQERVKRGEERRYVA